MTTERKKQKTTKQNSNVSKSVVSDNDIIIMAENIANIMTEVRSKAVWMVEDMIYKLAKNKINQDDRLVIASKIVRECINKKMSISDDYGEMLVEVKDIITEHFC